MIASDDGLDTALARVLHARGALELTTLQGVLEQVRAERSLNGVTLAGILRERDLVSAGVLEEAITSLGGSVERDAAAPARLPEVPGFRVLRELARGGMGAVYEVEGGGGVRFALKTLLPGGLTLDEAAIEEERTRFLREGQALAQLNHPNVVRIHAADLEGPVPYMIQDLLTGGTLQERLRKGPLPWQEAVHITAKLCEGMAHAHERGLLHRDLKPLNVLFDDAGEPRLVDFGLVRALTGSSLTQSGALMGTPSYMAPEQAIGGEVDERADVYGLGGILYALLCGGPPFAGEGLGILAAVVNDPPASIEASGVRAPAWVDAVCQRALSKAPEDRYASAREMAHALRAQSERARVVPRRVGTLAGALAAVVVCAACAVALSAWGLRVQRRAGALAAARAALGESVATLRSGLPAWAVHWDSLPPELVLAHGLVALDEGDAEGAARWLGRLKQVEDREGYAEALQGGAALLEAGPNPSAAALLASAREHLGCRELALWEATLRLREGSDEGRRAVIELGRSLRASSRGARLVRAAVYGLERPPSQPVVALIDGLLPEWSSVLRAWRFAGEAEVGVSQDMARLVRQAEAIPRELPRYVEERLRQRARSWSARLLPQLPSREVDPSALAPETYAGLAGWTRVARSLGLLEEFEPALEKMRAHVANTMPIYVSVGGSIPNERVEHVRALCATQIALCEELIRCGGYGPELCSGVLSLRERTHNVVQREFETCLRLLAEGAAPGSKLATWLTVYRSYAWVENRRYEFHSRAERAGLERVVATLEPLVGRVPTEATSSVTLLPISRFRLPGLVHWSLAMAKHLLGRDEESLVHFDALDALPVADSKVLPYWQLNAPNIRYRLGQALPRHSQAQDDLYKHAARESLRMCRRHAEALSISERRGVLAPAYVLRGRLDLDEREELLELTACFLGSIELPWTLRHGSLLLEAGRLEEAAKALSLDFDYSRHDQPGKPFEIPAAALEEARALGRKARLATTPALREELVEEIRLVIKRWSS